jgi:hypothetical protein
VPREQRELWPQSAPSIRGQGKRANNRYACERASLEGSELSHLYMTLGEKRFIPNGKLDN